MARFLALDGDAQQWQVVVGQVAKGGKVRVERAVVLAGEMPLSPANAAEAGRQLKERLKEAGIAPAPLLLTIGRDRVILKEVRHPAVTPTEEAALVRFQAVKDISDAPGDVVVDYIPGRETTGERRSLAVILRKDLLHTYQQFAEAAGLKLAGVTPRPFATYAAAVALAPEPPGPNDAVATLVRGERWGEFCVVRSGLVVLARALAGPALTADNALLGDIRRNLAVYAGQSQGQGVTGLYVSESPGAVDLSARLQPNLNVPVWPFDPLGGASDAPSQNRGAFAGAVGLLHLQASASGLPLNFVKPREPKPPPNPLNKKLAYVAAAVFAFAVVGGLFGYLQLDLKSRELARKVSEKEAAQLELTRAEQEATRGKDIDAWQAQEVVWLDELYDLVDRFPRGRDKERLDDNLRVKEIEIKTHAPPPPTTVTARPNAPKPKPKPPAELSVLGIMSPADRRLLNPIEQQFKEDKHYVVEAVTTHENKDRLTKDRYKTGFVLRMQVEKQAADKFTRRFTSVAPRRDEGGAGGMLNMFGGAFGGGNP